MRKSIAVGFLHAGIVLTVWLNYAWQQRTLPRAWARTAPVDPYDLMRGRYVRIGILAQADEATRRGRSYDMGELFVEGGQLHIRKAQCCVAYLSQQQSGSEEVTLTEPARFYIAEGIADPSILQPGDELWVELTVPKEGAPRPVQLARKKKDGSWLPLPLGRAAAGTK